MVRLPPAVHIRTFIFCWSNRPGYPHPACLELKNSVIRVTVGDCSVTERWRWRPALSNRKSCTCAYKTLQTQRGRTHDAGYARPWFRTTEPLGESRYENWLTTTSHFLELCGHDGQAPVQASFAVWWQLLLFNCIYQKGWITIIPAAHILLNCLPFVVRFISSF